VDNPDFYQENAEIRNDIARIDDEIKKIKREWPTVVMMVEKYRKK